MNFFRTRLGAAALGAAAVLAVASQAVAAPLVAGLGGPAGFGSNRLPTNDDGSSCSLFGGLTGSIDLNPAFPSGLIFFGMTFHELCLNNNGNITFGGGLSQFTPSPFPVASLRMIAPFWGDVDTRGGSLTDASHDAVYWDVRRGQFAATWHNVGYYSIHDDMQNDFQLVLRTFDGCGVGDFDVEFRYNRCEWVTGDASSGTGGHGGTPAQAGFDGGDSVHFYALPGSLTESIVNLCTTSNISEPGVWRFRIRGGELPCTGSGTACATGMQGACADGITTCHSGTATCDPLASPSSERCDGVDNDCNGTTDEGMNLCPAAYVCDRGSCVPQCVEGGCFDGQTCTPGGACVDNACLSMTCPAGQRCVSGTCVDACQGLHCPPPSVCRQGGCVVPCEGVVCDTGQVCENGRCAVSCMCRACTEGYSCSPDGTCQPTDCIGLNCPPGQVCLSALQQEPGQTAACVDPCTSAVCPQGQHCEAGRCAAGAPPTDGGVTTPDAGDDSSVPLGDSGVRTDAAHSDARLDGRADSGFGGGGRAGCACRTTSSSGSSRHSTLPLGAALAALALVAARRRRR
ncbi:MAG: nidogen-like domain-containing protein [Deltaproteobacteria bacterium]